ncbi:hypothetical protein B005_4652 [Nocardiopsis alba ATCC BAA-2165]|uniref:Uncharacterized protein n=1 Tax=Nocardiopsis alba (strain ATCC BAA-2165 / BE74) TaxID=1205910 RepID=J7KZ75_NOCAA|nr:hypothetical protein B005_4652 [Nocardiopsis alba ATCC BAA-2165]
MPAAQPVRQPRPVLLLCRLTGRRLTACHEPHHRTKDRSHFTKGCATDQKSTNVTRRNTSARGVTPP